MIAYQLLAFQSTPPVKAATDATMSYDTAPGISIHAAREGGDGCGAYQWSFVLHFNPRRP